MVLNDDYIKIANMSNKEAADILQATLDNFVEPRGSGKSKSNLALQMALSKAIDLLERTPDY